MKVKRNLLKTAGMLVLSAVLAFVPLLPAQAEEALPSVTVDSVTWDGGMLEVPVDWGNYDSDKTNVTLEFEGSRISFLETEIMEDHVGFNLFLFFAEAERNLFLSKSGTYEMTVQFSTLVETESGETYLSSEDSFDLIVPSDSEQWEMQSSRVVFDGSEDIVFQFKNGTNFLEISDISYVYIFYSKPVGLAMYDGYTFDAASGEMRIDKDAFINTLKSYDYSEDMEWDVPVNDWETVTIDIMGVTTGGIEIPYCINVMQGPGGFLLKPWTVDLSGLDLSGMENVATEFTGTSSDLISISADTGNLISQSALSYIQANYGELLAGLGSYTVRARLELAELDENSLDQAVKTAFAPYLKEWTAGRYYTIEIVADVVKAGEIVEGLGNIVIPRLSEDAGLTLTIPEELTNDGRIYEMLHYQDGTAEMIGCGEKDGTITFKTDRFSPFALVYKDMEVDNTGGENNVVNPKTGDLSGAGHAAWIVMISLAAITSFITLQKRNKGE